MYEPLHFLKVDVVLVGVHPSSVCEACRVKGIRGERTGEFQDSNSSRPGVNCYSICIVSYGEE
jgi:hypothetical protein